MSDPFDSNLLRVLQEAETLADAGGSEELLSQIRENIEILLVLTFYTGTGSTATQDPPDDTTGVLTDSAATWTDDEHNGRSLVMIDGLAAGNIYTIDDTVDSSNTIVCTGDNLYSDGVRSGDKYKIFYNIKGFTAHDHDAINSALVALADNQVTQAKIADNAVGQAEMIDASIGEAELRTNTGTVNHTATTYANLVLPGSDYALYPRINMSTTATIAWGAQILKDQAIFAGWTSAVTSIALRSDASNTIIALSRYITASGEVHWVFILRDKISKKIISLWEAPDHPCFGNGGKPLLLQHPFLDFDSATQEIIVINPDVTQVSEIQNRIIDAAEDIPDRCIGQVIAEDYNIDETIEPPWPSIPITVGLPPDWAEKPIGSKIVPIKKVIPKPPNVKTARIVLK